MSVSQYADGLTLLLGGVRNHAFHCYRARVQALYFYSLKKKKIYRDISLIKVGIQQDYTTLYMSNRTGTSKVNLSLVTGNNRYLDCLSEVHNKPPLNSNYRRYTFCKRNITQNIKTAPQENRTLQAKVPFHTKGAHSNEELTIITTKKFKCITNKNRKVQI